MEALKILAAFAAGIGCGILATRTYFSKHYKDMADSEIESVIENYKERDKKRIEKAKKKEEEDKTMYNNVTKSYISSAPPTINAKEEHPEDDEPEEPYQITSMDFFDDAEYDKESVTYYVDECLVGPNDEGGEDLLVIDTTIGTDAIELLKNGFDDGSALYIRNPKLGVDYEVSKSYASYKGMMLDD